MAGIQSAEVWRMGGGGYASLIFRKNDGAIPRFLKSSNLDVLILK